METELYTFIVPASDSCVARGLGIYLSSGYFVVKHYSNLDDFTFNIKFETLDKALKFCKWYLQMELDSLFD